jgi:hypothetical protein
MNQVRQTKQKQLTDHDLELISRLKRRDIIEIDWSRLYEEYKFPESFVEKHPKQIDWDLLSLYQNLSPEFVTRNIDKITANILLNPYYENYPDSLKLLLETKFRSQLEEMRQQSRSDKPLLIGLFGDCSVFALFLICIAMFILNVILKTVFPHLYIFPIK